MSATWTRWRPAARRARARAALAATTALALLVAPIVGAAPAVAAPTGTLSNVAITVTDDGTASVGGIDPATDNGVVATNNPVTMRWEIEATDLVDGVFSQTLPAGWSWVASSLGRLTSTSTLYQSAYTISADGLTLTATISVPGSGLVTISGLQAVPAPTVASGSGHTPTVTATDGGTTQTATGTALTVASTPQAELGMYYASRSGATHDFGSGDEAAVRVAALLLYRAQATLVGQRLPLEVELPQRLTLAYTGPQPDAVTLCDDDTSGSLTLVSAADGTIVVDLLTQPTTALAAPRVCFWYRTADLPVGATDAETLTVSLVEPGLTTTDGTAVVRSGTDSTSTSVYVDSPDVPVVPPRPATASTNLARWSWSSNPAGPVLPAYSTRAWTTGLPNAVDSGGTILTQSLYTPAYDYAAGTSVGTEDLVGYQFWDPATATIVDDESAVAVSRSTTALDPSTYRLEFTSTRSTTDPATANTWYPTIAEAGGPTAVSGVRVVYTAGLWADGQASGTTSQLVLGVPTVARADGVVTSMSVTHVWTTADADPLLRYTTVGIQPFSMNANLSSSDAQIVSGGPVTFSVSVGAGHSTTRPPTAPDFEGVVTLTVTMPPQVISVDTSAATAAGWTLVSETPADVGADGLPGTSDDGAGIVLVLSRAAVVTVAAAADLPAFSLPTVTTLRAPANETMTATLSARYDVTSPVPTAMAASASRAVSVLQAQGLVMEGSTSTPHLAATDRTAVWSTRWSNYNNTVIEGTSYVMDVLPYVGDGRGTTGEGRVTLAGAELRGEALTTGVIEVTTAAPGTIGTAPGSGVTWTELTEDTDLSAVTAVRVRLSSIAVGAVSGLDLTTTVSGHDLGDVFVNSASSYSEATTLVMSSPDVAVEVVGSTVAGRVLTDPDRDGLATSDGEPAAGVTVRLVDTGSDVVLTAVTGADGSYSFTGVGSGTYRVEVVQSTLSGSSVTPTVDPDDVLDGMTEVTVGLQDEVTGLDFAFAVRNPALTVSTAGEAPSGSLAAGDVVTFVSTVTNSGDAPLSGLVVQDDLAAGRATGTWTWPGAAGALAVGESATYTVRYTLDQTDVDAGSVSTTVRATASDDVGTEVTGTATAQVTVPAGAALTVTGAGTPPAAVAADGTVRWTVTIENTGAATVTGIDLTDTLAGMSGWTITWPGTDGRLAPGQQAVATATSALTQAQVDAGVVTSVATATGQASDASEVRATATTPVTFTVPGAVTVRLEADGTHVTTAPGTPVTDGDDIAWTYTVTNTGAATLHGVTVSDDRVPATTITAPAGFTGDLAPGESVVLTATSVATFGEHPVTATVQATAGDGTATVADTDTVWYAATAAERGSVTGHVRIDTARDGLTSTAGTPATGVGVRLVDTATDDVLRTVTDAQGTYGFSGLAAGTYRVEVEQGTVTGDIVTVTVDPDGVLDGVTEVTLGGRQTVADLDFAVAVRNPALALTVSPQASSGALAAGDQVTFTYTLTNSGDTPLTGITVPDSLDPARVSTTATWPADEGVLAAGEQATITVTYTLDQADVDAGLVTTRAHGEATDDLGTEVTSATVTAQVIVPSGAALTVTGTGALPEQIAAGEQVDWTMTIANTGATTVSAIEVTDALAGMSDYVVTWPGTPGVLAPGEEAVASATSTLTQEQVDAGTAVASVTATGSAAPDGVEVSTSVQVPVRFNVPGQVRIEVELNGSRWSEAPGLEVLDGAELVWTYRVTNIGAVTLHDVAVSDDRASGSMIQAPEGFTGDLAPGESVVLTASSVATVGVWPVSARVEAIEGTVGTQIVAADVAWYTATAVAIDPAAPAGGGGTGGSGTSSEVSASGAGATGAGTTTSQVLAVTGASVLGLAALALLVTLVGAGLVRARTLREAAER